MFQKPHIPDTSGCLKNIRFRCIPKKNTSKLHKIKQSRCIHPSKSIKLSNPRCHLAQTPSESPRKSKWNTSKLHKIKQSRCIHPSKSIKLSNPRCHIIPSEANLRANQSEIHQNSSKTPHINQIEHSTSPPYPNFTYYLRITGNLLYIPPLLSL